MRGTNSHTAVTSVSNRFVLSCFNAVIVFVGGTGRVRGFCSTGIAESGDDIDRSQGLLARFVHYSC
jgi:hypothetical protein